MARSALALWFTLATLLGPGVCCCSGVATASGSDLQPATKPIKSCCSREVHTVAKERSDGPLQEKPGQCPCERGKAMADSVPANGSTPQEFDESLRTSLLYPVEFVDLDSFHSSDRDPIVSFVGTPPNQRECLTAFCVMRC